MAQFGNIIVCAAAMAAIWTVIGLPVAVAVTDRSHSWLWAPALGWAIHNVVALPLFEWIGFGRLGVVLLTATFVLAALAAFGRQTFGGETSPIPVHIPAALLLGVIAAAILALIPMQGIVPKVTTDGVTLASPIFDHSKIAMIDEMIRSGVPARNPFIGEPGTPDRVAYYYLWHFSAAVAAITTGVTAWEADAALTWFTAFASLSAMIGLAMNSGARAPAALVVVVLATSASARATLEWFWPAGTPDLIGSSSGFGGWLFQTSWAPQHVASAMCVVIVCALLPRFGQRGGWLVAAVAGLVAAAAFQSSVWVGGIVLAPAAAAIGLLCIGSLASGLRLLFVRQAAMSAAMAAVLAMPFVYDQLVNTALRGDAAMLQLTPVSVFGPTVPENLSRILDVPAYWLVYLPVELPAIYLPALAGFYLLLKNRAGKPERPRHAHVLLLLTAMSLLTGGVAASVIGENNDLGWRAVLPAVLVLIAVAATAISWWPVAAVRIAGVLAAVGLVVSLPETLKIAQENLFGLRKPSERIFAATPSMWQAVRQHTSAIERVANNPLFLRDMTPWPVNISWALLGGRRSCFAGSELAIPFAPISATRRDEIDALFVRVFAGEPAPGDVSRLAQHFRCDTVVLTAQDGAWQRDPFASGAFYRLVDSRSDAWRIYRRTAEQR